MLKHHPKRPEHLWLNYSSTFSLILVKPDYNEAHKTIPEAICHVGHWSLMGIPAEAVCTAAVCSIHQVWVSYSDHPWFMEMIAPTSPLLGLRAWLLKTHWVYRSSACHMVSHCNEIQFLNPHPQLTWIFMYEVEFYLPLFSSRVFAPVTLTFCLRQMTDPGTGHVEHKTTFRALLFFICERTNQCRTHKRLLTKQCTPLRWAQILSISLTPLASVCVYGC